MLGNRSKIPRLLEIARDCSRLLEIARDCSRLLEIARDCSRLLEIARERIYAMKIEVFVLKDVMQKRCIWLPFYTVTMIITTKEWMLGCRAGVSTGPAP